LVIREEVCVKKFVRLLTILWLANAVPAWGQGAATPAVKEAAPGLFVAEGPVELAGPENGGAICNRSFVIGGEAIAVIDTGGSYAAGVALKAAIRARSSLPIRYVVNTHMHPDHVLGNAAFREEGAVFVGHAKLPRALAARSAAYLDANRRLIGEAAFAGTEIVPPTLLVEKETTLDLGGRVLRLSAHPTAHTDNDLTVLDETTHTLILGDLLFDSHLPVIDGSLNGWLTVLGALTQTGAQRAVPGHGAANLPWPGAADAERGYLSALRDDLRRAIRAGWPLARAIAEIKPAGAERWRLIEDFHRRNISAGYAEMEWE
jgi:quinoprotein relay system zinc metallohydrolase 2